MKAKINKFIKSVYFKLLQQVIFILLAVVLAGCAAVQGSYWQPTVYQGADSALQVTRVSQQEVLNGLKSVGVAGSDDYIMVKPGLGYVLSYMQAQGSRVFVMVFNTSDTQKWLPTCIQTGCWRSAEIESNFIKDGWQNVTDNGTLQKIIPIISSILTKAPGMVSIFIVPIANETEILPWLNQQEQEWY